MKIRWSPTAVSDLESVRGYIAKDSPTAAARVANTIKVSVNRLKDFPLSGRVGRVPETRELVVAGTNYIVAYTIDGEEVFIASVLHGRQSWPESL
jgi:addiction module RelE/StbE family toxin